MAKTPKLKPEAETADQAPADVVQAETVAVEALPAPAPAPAEAAPAATQTDNAATETLLVTGPKSGRRRAGRQFGPEPVTLLVDELTEGDLAAIEADPLLRVTRVAAPY